MRLDILTGTDVRSYRLRNKRRWWFQYARWFPVSAATAVAYEATVQRITRQNTRQGVNSRQCNLRSTRTQRANNNRLIDFDLSSMRVDIALSLYLSLPFSRLSLPASLSLPQVLFTNVCTDTSFFSTNCDTSLFSSRKTVFDQNNVRHLTEKKICAIILFCCSAILKKRNEFYFAFTKNELKLFCSVRCYSRLLYVLISIMNIRCRTDK